MDTRIGLARRPEHTYRIWNPCRQDRFGPPHRMLRGICAQAADMGQAKDLEVDDFSDAKENQTPAWDRGDRCIVSYGDALADEPCCDPPTQLDLDAAEYLWDGEYDFTTYEDKELAAETCYYNDEVEDYDHNTEDCEDNDYEAEMGDWDSNAEDF